MDSKSDEDYEAKINKLYPLLGSKTVLNVSFQTVVPVNHCNLPSRDVKTRLGQCRITD